MNEKPFDYLAGNQRWQAKMQRCDGVFFEKLSAGQSPERLWLSCVDSRVSPTQICDAPLGELFVHRNIANQANAEDLSFLATLRYAVDVLGVREIVVCGHSHCGGVHAALSEDQVEDVEPWIAPIRALAERNHRLLEPLDSAERVDKLVRLNVEAQLIAISNTRVVQDAWKRGMTLSLVGLVFDLETGALEDCGVRLQGLEDLEKAQRLQAH